MRKPELVEAIAVNAGLTRTQADDALSSLLEQITNALARGESIQLLGFGSFVVRHRGAREGKNPQTGDAIHIPEKNQVAFRPGTRLREQLAQPS